jgi:hypothetical protein
LGYRNQQGSMAQQPASILLEALQALYHHPEQAVKDAASKWLEDFQQVRC